MMKKRLASLLLAITLIIGVLPLNVYADINPGDFDPNGSTGDTSTGAPGSDFEVRSFQGYRIYLIDIYSDPKQSEITAEESKSGKYGPHVNMPYQNVEVITTPIDILFSKPKGQIGGDNALEKYYETKFDKDVAGSRKYIPNTIYYWQDLLDKGYIKGVIPPTPITHNGSLRIPQGDDFKKWMMGSKEAQDAIDANGVQAIEDEKAALKIREYYDLRYAAIMANKKDKRTEYQKRCQALNELFTLLKMQYNSNLEIYGYDAAYKILDKWLVEYDDILNEREHTDKYTTGIKNAQLPTNNLHNLLNARLPILDKDGNPVKVRVSYIDADGNRKSKEETKTMPLICYRDSSGNFVSTVKDTGRNQIGKVIEKAGDKNENGDTISKDGIKFNLILTQLMQQNGYRLIVEPIRWWTPHSYPNNYRYDKQVYGTITNIYDWALRMEGKDFSAMAYTSNKDGHEILTYIGTEKWQNQPLKGTKDHIINNHINSMHNASANSLIVENPIKQRVEYVSDGTWENGKLVQTPANPDTYLTLTNDMPYKGVISLETGANRAHGITIHDYGIKYREDWIETFTIDPGPTPPKGESGDATTVKVYTDRQLNEDGGYVDTPAGTYVTQKLSEKIEVSQEPDYRVDEWYDIRSDNRANKRVDELPGGPMNPPLNWDDTENESGLASNLEKTFTAGTELTKGKPGSDENVHLTERSKEQSKLKRVVYIHLIKTSKPVIEAKLTESQVSKVIGTAENIDSKTEGLTGPWGRYTMDIHLEQLNPSSHQYTVHEGCSRKNCTDPCCDDYTSTCGAISRINGDNKISWTYGVQNAASKAVLTAPGTKFDNLVKSSTEVGNTIKFDETVDDGEYTRQFNSDSQASNGLVAYQTIWRGNQDNLTLANYKKQSMGATFDILNESSTITGKPVIPAKNSNPTPRKSNGKHAELLDTSLLITQADTLVIGRCLGGGQHHNIATVQQNATMTQELKFKVPITIYTYSGATSSAPSKASPALTTALTNKTATTNNKSQGRVDLSINQTQSPLTFNPYIRMSYRITEDGIDNSHVKHDKGLSERTAFILSDKQSSIIPNNGVEISWYNGTQVKNGYGLQLNSKQWSMHKKATEAPAKEKNPWQGKDKVLPGGALYELGTAGTESVVTSTTYSTFVDQASRNWISVNDKNKYTIPSITAANNSYITEFRNNLDNFRIVQMVTELNGKKSVEISAGNQETLQAGVKTSTDSKYILTNGTGTNGIMEADLDINKEVYQTTIYKCFTDTEGNVYLATASQSTKNKVITQQETEKLAKSLESICGTNRGSAVLIGTKGQTAAQILAKQSPAIQSMNNKTGLISNVVNSVERNTGNDMKAAWVTDGHWYNEAYDGSYIIAQTIQYTVGLGVPNKRIAILDPALCPKSTGKGDIFTKAYTSQFKLSSKSTAAPAGKNPGYVGTFDTIPVEIPGIQNMFMSKTFSIPNATVQDLS